mmetsp:Transcript_48127/g.114670  ORF Transcript_48127/g.114670 Transcript_48127/m.114670 type:complete len:334 (-) Transcript_48127:2113-3114(-)
MPQWSPGCRCRSCPPWSRRRGGPSWALPSRVSADAAAYGCPAHSCVSSHPWAATQTRRSKTSSRSDSRTRPAPWQPSSRMACHSGSAPSRCCGAGSVDCRTECRRPTGTRPPKRSPSTPRGRTAHRCRAPSSRGRPRRPHRRSLPGSGCVALGCGDRRHRSCCTPSTAPSCRRHRASGCPVGSGRAESHPARGCRGAPLSRTWWGRTCHCPSRTGPRCAVAPARRSTCSCSPTKSPRWTNGNPRRVRSGPVLDTSHSHPPDLWPACRSCWGAVPRCGAAPCRRGSSRQSTSPRRPIRSTCRPRTRHSSGCCRAAPRTYPSAHRVAPHCAERPQ